MGCDSIVVATHDGVHDALERDHSAAVSAEGLRYASNMTGPTVYGLYRQVRTLGHEWALFSNCGRLRKLSRGAT